MTVRNVNVSRARAVANNTIEDRGELAPRRRNKGPAEHIVSCPTCGEPVLVQRGFERRCGTCSTLVLREARL
jgi:hypothetical protein